MLMSFYAYERHAASACYAIRRYDMAPLYALRAAAALYKIARGWRGGYMVALFRLR